MLMMISFSTIAFAEEVSADNKGEYAAIKAAKIQKDFEAVKAILIPIIALERQIIEKEKHKIQMLFLFLCFIAESHILLF